jgi:glycosyltransferase involved in cell wall biosynthesis
MVAPSLSVIIPVRNGGAAFPVCLEALSRSKYRDFELVVVDDGSSDGSDEAARRHDATVLTTGGAEGPAAARNLGAAVASAETLLFLDADCEVHEDTLDRVVEALTDDQLVAVFGSYDDEPKAKGIVSRFRNLLHHFVHQTSRPEIETFWAGCGAVRKQAFLAVGGFDAERYQRPSIEDIDLGYRLTDAGGRIAVRPDVLVRHHKRWSFVAMVVTDVRDRGIPWTALLLRRGSTSRDLNLSARGRLGVLLAAAFFASLPVAVAWPPALAASSVAAAALVILNWDFYRFLFDKGGFGFATFSVALHAVHLASSAAAYIAGGIRHLVDPH